MEWLRGKALPLNHSILKEPLTKAQKRPGSRGSARDLADVLVETNRFVHEGADAAGVAAPRSNDVQPWQATPEQGGKPPNLLGDHEMEPKLRSTKKGSAEMSKPELARKLFDSIDKSGDGALSKDELMPALQVHRFFSAAF